MKIIQTCILSLCITSLSIAQENPYRGEEERINDLVHTKLKVDFDIPQEQMNGEAWITLQPHFYPTNSVTLDAKGMLIHEVSILQNGKKKKLQYDYDNKELIIELGKSISKDESYDLYIKYTARPNEVEQAGSAAITEAKGLYFIDPRDEDPTKPTQIWTQGETESSSAWFPTIDSPNQKTTEEIYITVPNEYVTLSNGTLLNQTNNSDGTRTDYWKQDQKHAPYLFYMGVGDFAVVKDEWKGKPVNYYVEHEYAAYAQEIFGLTPEMITFYSDKFGYEFPWDKYSQMVARDYVSGAMENTTAVIHMLTAQQKHGQLVDENVWEDVIAHELAHHWFGDLVTAESWSNLTVNESFANYSEYLWREYKYGKASADEHRKEDLQGYLMGQNFDKNLVRFHYDSREDMFDGVTYNKGGYILHMLRSFLGDEAFFAGLKNYLHKNEFGKAEATELRLALEEVSGKDLNWFFNQWYNGNGHPKLTVVTENSNNATVLNIRQTQEPLFEFPLTVDVYENGVRKRHTVWIEKKKVNTLNLATSGSTELVVVNADNDLIAEIEQDYSTQEYIKLYNYSIDEYTNRTMALDGLASLQLNNDQALSTLIKALDDAYEGIRIQAIKALDLTDSGVSKLAKKKLIYISENDPKTLVRAAALNSLAKLNDTSLSLLFTKATSADSFAMQAAGLNGLLTIDKNKALEVATNVDDDVIAKSPELLSAMIPIWKANNDVTHFNALTEIAAFYSFMAFQNPELSAPAEEAFTWIMSVDSPEATSKILTMHTQVYNQLKSQQPMALPFIIKMTENALMLKKKAYESNPKASLKSQVESIEKTLAKFD